MTTRGFTLIELLVVIVIIAILAAFIYPVATRAMENGVQSDCTTNLHNIALAVKQYMTDHRGAPPPSPWQDDGTGTYAYYPDLGLEGLLEKSGSLPLVCKDDPRTPDDFIDDGMANSCTYVMDTAYRNTNVPAAAELRLLYNFYGYTDRGYEAAKVDYYDVARNTPNSSPPAGLGKWTDVPMLVLRGRAPKTTIITHCPMHREHGVELIVRLDGSVDKKAEFMVDVDADTTAWDGGTEWIAQPK